MLARKEGSSEAREAGERSVRRRMRELGVRRWPLMVIGVLLLIESAGLAVVGTLNFTEHIVSALLPALRPLDTPLGVGFLLLSPLALVAALGFLRLWRRAWLAAMLLQGLSLMVALMLYFYLSEEPGYLFAGMAYSIFLIFYLNSHGVRSSFQPRNPDREP